MQINQGEASGLKLFNVSASDFQLLVYSHSLNVVTHQPIVQGSLQKLISVIFTFEFVIIIITIIIVIINVTIIWHVCTLSRSFLNSAVQGRVQPESVLIAIGPIRAG